jgi:hypothetical protein
MVGEWAQRVHAFLGWAYYNWPSDEQLRDWYALLERLKKGPEEEQAAFYSDLAAQFRDMFAARDYGRVRDGDEGVMVAPRDHYTSGVQMKREEEKMLVQFGSLLLGKLKRAWKEEGFRTRRRKQAFFAAAGIEARWSSEATTEQQREEAWGHIQGIVALARMLHPPRDRFEAEFPSLWDLAEADARESTPRDPSTTHQSQRWHDKVLESTQSRYSIYCRKAKDPARPDGHKKFVLPNDPRREGLM